MRSGPYRTLRDIQILFYRWEAFKIESRRMASNYQNNLYQNNK